MVAYKPYPDAKTEPRRKARKNLRRSIFYENKLLANVVRKEKRLARKKEQADAEGN